jgi:hypothetical protein
MHLSLAVMIFGMNEEVIYSLVMLVVFNVKSDDTNV